MKFIPKGPNNTIPALVQVIAWCRKGDKPLSEPMMVKLTDAFMRHSATSYEYIDLIEKNNFSSIVLIPCDCVVT